MPHIKAIDADWLKEAWALSAVIRDLPTHPFDGGLLGSALQLPKLPDITKQRLLLLQSKIALHLAYRLHMVHKINWRTPDGKKGMFIIEHRDPESFLDSYADLAHSKNFRPHPEDSCAIWAHMVLGNVLRDRFATEDTKRELPLWIASIGGSSAARSAAAKASRLRPGRRDRNAELREAKARRERHSPGETWKEQLRHLKGAGRVAAWDAVSIEWVTNDGERRSTKTKTFINW